jgi:hypothetical protein
METNIRLKSGIVRLKLNTLNQTKRDKKLKIVPSKMQLNEKKKKFK